MISQQRRVVLCVNEIEKKTKKPFARADERSNYRRESPDPTTVNNIMCRLCLGRISRKNDVMIITVVCVLSHANGRDTARRSNCMIFSAHSELDVYPTYMSYIVETFRWVFVDLSMT